jgi:hypothetical protein
MDNQLFLNSVLKEILNERIVYDDGQVTFGALDVELIERALHNVDRSFKPTRPDSAVMPCVHNCDYCHINDVPSEE